MQKHEPKIVSLTIRELMESQNALQNLESLPLEPKTAYWIGKTMGRVRKQFNSISKRMTDRRNELVKEHGTEITVDDGSGTGSQRGTGQYKIEPTDVAAVRAFNDAFDAALDEAAEIEVTPISIEALGDVKISSGDCASLSWLLVE